MRVYLACLAGPAQKLPSVLCGVALIVVLLIFLKTTSLCYCFDSRKSYLASLTLCFSSALLCFSFPSIFLNMQERCIAINVSCWNHRYPILHCADSWGDALTSIFLCQAFPALVGHWLAVNVFKRRATPVSLSTDLLSTVEWQINFSARHTTISLRFLYPILLSTQCIEIEGIVLVNNDEQNWPVRI